MTWSSVPIGRELFGKILMSKHDMIVAVVDDDPEIRAAMASLLSAFGYRAETFDSAKTFLACASTCKAMCLILDIQLGDISGVELAHQLKAGGFKFPIVFMTGLDDEVIQRQAIASGAIAFLRKPFPASVLVDALKKAKSGR
jgi:FixJ family two-component response regulator